MINLLIWTSLIVEKRLRFIYSTSFNIVLSLCIHIHVVNRFLLFIEITLNSYMLYLFK